MGWNDRISIDGSEGEGGGQVLRTSLALAMATGRPVVIENVRARRKRSGLRPQHVAAVRAAARMCGADVSGDEPESQAVVFVPGPVVPGEHEFRIETAGSTTLVLQTVLPPLLRASGPSTLRFVGGTHNPLAPPYDFIERAFLPIVSRLGARIECSLERYGFYPAGGGRFEVRVTPAAALTPLHLAEPVAVRSTRARAIVAHLPRRIAERELEVVRDRLGWPGSACETIEVTDSLSPGNVLSLEVENDSVTEVFTGFGEPGKPAEVVAEGPTADVQRYLASGVCIGEYLADQLLLPLALAGHGSFTTHPLSLHARTNIDVIQKFLEVPITARETGEDQRLVEIG